MRLKSLMTENYCFIGQNWAEKNLIRPDEFRKNAVKILGWELWEPEKT
jgi:hypothetical protein